MYGHFEPSTLLTLAMGLGFLGVLGTTFLKNDNFIKNMIGLGLATSEGLIHNLLHPTVKTAAYTIDPTVDPSGTVFTNRGDADSLTYTLPAAHESLKGFVYDFFGVADQEFVVAAAAGEMVTFNNAAATSLTVTTAGQHIGAHIRAVCDGTSWLVHGDTVGVTYTVA